MDAERIHKVLSHAGFGSRREIERWIMEGCITINGKVAELGDPIKAIDKIFIRGKPIRNPLKDQFATRILLYHKPIGEICSRKDPKFPKTVFDNLPALEQGRWVAVGRLDLNTSGLLIFTNNGTLANHLMHPKFALEREYAVRVRGEVSHDIIKTLLKGVDLEDGRAQFKRISAQGGEGTNSWYHVVLTEGKNREVRRLWESQGVEVSRLIRLRYGPFILPRSLARGRHKELTPKEVAQFLAVHQVEGDGAKV